MKKLFTAIRQNSLENVTNILEKNPQLVNCMAIAPPKKDEGQSPLQVAIKVGNLTIAQYLIEKGADVNHMEPDNGLPPTQTYRCPVLFDAIMMLFSRWERQKEQHLQLILQLLQLGADPNKQDNRGSISWDLVLTTYGNMINRIVDAPDKDLFMNMTKELLNILIRYNVDILNIDRIKKDLKPFENYSLMLENLILNRDDSYGVSPEQIDNWNKNSMPIIKLAKSYYGENNPYYEENGNRN